MRNIIVGPAWPLRGGIAHFSESLCKEFLKNELSSAIVSFSFQYPHLLFPGKTQLEAGPAPVGIDISPMLNSIYPGSWRKTARYLVEQQPDYLVVMYWSPYMALALGSLARMVKRRSRIKIISVVHNVTPHEAGFLDRALSAYFFRSCDGFVTLSASALDHLKQINPAAPSAWAPHPVYDFFGPMVTKKEAMKHLNLEPGVNYLLFFGLIRSYKGLDLLIKAMVDPRLKKRNLKLIVAGEFYDKKSKYTVLVKEESLQDRIIFTDHYVPNEEVKYYFGAADLVVQPYRTATQSGVTQIAYHFEKPMIVSNVGGLPEIVPNGEVGYVTRLSPDSIAEAINDFYALEKAEEFSKNTAKLKHRFQWNNVVSKIEELARTLK